MKKERFFYGWVVVGAGLIVWIVEPGIFTSFGVFFKPIAAEFNWSRATVSSAISLTSLMLGLLAPITGALCDRYGPRKLIMASAILTAAGYILLSQVETLWQFYGSYLLVGVGMGFAFAPITSTIIRWFEKRRGLALGLGSVGTGIGGIFFPPLNTYLINLWGWRTSYLFLGILLGIAVLGAGILLRRDPAEMGLAPYGAQAEGKLATDPASHPAPPSFTLVQALKTGAYWRVFAVATTSVFVFVMLQVHLVPYATDRGLTPAVAATVMSVMGLGNIVGRLGLGALSDRSGRKRILLMLLATNGLALLFLLLAQEAWMFYLFAFVFGAAFGGSVVSWFGLPAELFGFLSLGAIVGLTQSGSNLGAAAGSYMAGYIFDLTGSYTIAFLTGSALLFSTIAFLLPLRAPSPGIRSGKR